VPFQRRQDLPREGYQIHPCRLPGVPVFKLEVQALLPQPSEASQAYMDSHVQKAAQEGMSDNSLSSIFHLEGFLYRWSVACECAETNLLEQCCLVQDVM
jgi:hypothetical protein